MKLNIWCKAGAASLLLVAVTGCQNLPGDERTQGAVIGGASGAILGAAVGGEDHRLLGAVLGGILGAGGGYVIGTQVDKVRNGDKDSARTAARKAEENPATAEDARRATTADLNSDGFVTLDEVVAMEKANFSDTQILDRLEATGQVFVLTAENRDYLRRHGVSDRVIRDMERLNQEEREELLSSGDVISRDR